MNIWSHIITTTTMTATIKKYKGKHFFYALLTEFLDKNHHIHIQDMLINEKLMIRMRGEKILDVDMTIKVKYV